MKAFIFRGLLLFMAPVFLAASCERGKCPKNVVCTEVFSMVTVRVTDQQGVPVKLDEAYTTRSGKNETIRPEQHMEGAYIVLDDSYLKNLQNDKDDFRFVGIKDGKKVIDEVFVIGADCCHVQKISGKEEIRL